eukprot:scaffold127448_cov18-Tisochrysis_lutea.AAC.1
MPETAPPSAKDPCPIAPSPSALNGNESGAETVRIHVGGMSCASCVQALSKRLHRFVPPPVESTYTVFCFASNAGAVWQMLMPCCRLDMGYSSAFRPLDRGLSVDLCECLELQLGTRWVKICLVWTSKQAVHPDASAEPLTKCAQRFCNQ